MLMDSAMAIASSAARDHESRGRVQSSVSVMPSTAIAIAANGTSLGLFIASPK